MASIKHRASATWQESGKEGTGSLTTQSATLKAPCIPSLPVSTTEKEPILRS